MLLNVKLCGEERGKAGIAAKLADTNHAEEYRDGSLTDFSFLRDVIFL